MKMRVNFIFFYLGAMISRDLYSMELRRNNQLSTDSICLQIQQINEQWLKRFGIVWKTDDFDFWHSLYNDPCANGITRFSLANTSKITENVNCIMDYSIKHSVPFSWSVSLDDNGEDLNALLKKYNGMEEKSIIMIHSLDTIMVNNHIPEVSIEPLRRDNYREWLSVINSAFGEYDSNFTAMYAQLIEKDLENTDTSWKYFAGYFNKKLVATGVLLVHSHYGYIANIATSLHYRGKGIATAMTVALLQEAKKLNLSYVLLQAAQDSHAAKIYEKIGFQAAAHLNVYVFGATK